MRTELRLTTGMTPIACNRCAEGTGGYSEKADHGSGYQRCSKLEPQPPTAAPPRKGSFGTTRVAEFSNGEPQPQGRRSVPMSAQGIAQRRPGSRVRKMIKSPEGAASRNDVVRAAPLGLRFSFNRRSQGYASLHPGLTSGRAVGPFVELSAVGCQLSAGEGLEGGWDAGGGLLADFAAILGCSSKTFIN